MPEKTDISQQIKKYLNGELNARAMHELERRAQDDPFLMDALEGYQTTPVDLNAGLNELNSRLQQRTQKKEARIISWRTMSIAASILILLGIGLFWYSGRKPSESIQKNVASAPVMHAPEAAKSVSATSGGNDTTSTPKDKKFAKLIANNTRRRPKPQPGPTVAATEADEMPQAIVNEKAGYFANADKVAKDTTTPLNEVIVMNYSAKKNTNNVSQYKSVDTTLQPVSKAYVTKIDTSGFKVTRIKGTDIAKLDDNQKGRDANASMPGMPPNLLIYQSRTAQANSDIAASSARPVMSALMSSPARGYFAKRAATGGIAPLNPVIVHGKMMKGMVKESGEPVAYANVKIKGTTISTLTDSKGEFTLYAVPDSAIIQILADGYVLKETKVTRRDMQVISIHLLMNTSNDGAAIAPNDNGVTDNMRPRPSTDWDDLNSYLRQNAISPDGKVGIVKVSFTVNPDNSLSDFRIVQSLSTQTDNAAIKLIKDGPAWYSSSDDKAGSITISIKFHARGK